MGRILAIDFGLKRTGLAVTDPLKIIASPLETVESKQLILFLKNYFAKEYVELIVLGHPKHLNNEDAEIMPNIKLLIQELNKNFPTLKIELFDERYTSKMASKALVEGGFKKKDRQKKSNIDKMAATILLQEYMQMFKI